MIKHLGSSTKQKFCQAVDGRVLSLNGGSSFPEVTLTHSLIDTEWKMSNSRHLV